MNRKIGMLLSGIVVAVIVVAVVLVTHYRIRGHGRIKTIGLGAYTTIDCTTVVTEIDWGDLSPGEVALSTIFLKNIGNVPVNITQHTETWKPEHAEDYMNLTWNYNGVSLASLEVLEVQFTLSVFENITNVNSFSFDIVLTATEVT